MILTRDKGQGDYEIRFFKKGQLKINDSLYYESLILGAHILQPWSPQEFQEVSLESLTPLLEFKPEIVLLGTGDKLIFPDRKILQLFYDQKVGIEVMSTLAACRTFNVLMSEGRNVIAALLIQ